MNQKSSSEARKHFPDKVNEAVFAKKRYVITRRGKRLVAIVPIEDLEMIEYIED